MTTILNIPLKSLDEKTIRELKEKYPEAVIRIETEMEGVSMDENRFWAIIDQLDWSKEKEEAILKPAVEALSLYPIEEIQAFHELLAQKLYALDGAKYAGQMGNSPFSADTFLYSRCVVVANGREFYQKVLADPTSMPKGYSFESLLYLPEEAFKLKTGEDRYDYIPETWYETFSNPDGWPDKIPLKERLSGKA